MLWAGCHCVLIPVLRHSFVGSLAHSCFDTKTGLHVGQTPPRGETEPSLEEKF